MVVSARTAASVTNLLTVISAPPIYPAFNARPPPSRRDAGGKPSDLLASPEAGGRQCIRLALREAPDLEPFDLRIEEPVEIHLRPEMQEHAAKADRRPVHEHEFARHLHGALLLQRLMHL